MHQTDEQFLGFGVEVRHLLHGMHTVAHAEQVLKDGIKNNEVTNEGPLFIKFDSCVLSKDVFAVKPGIDIGHLTGTIYLRIFVSQ